MFFGGTPFPKWYQDKGNADTVAFPQVGLQRNAKSIKLILRKIIEIVVTRCHILKLNAPNLILASAPTHTPLELPHGWI